MNDLSEKINELAVQEQLDAQPVAAGNRINGAGN